MTGPHRLAAGLSPETLAERAGLSGQAISALESGPRAPLLGPADAPHHNLAPQLTSTERRSVDPWLEAARRALGEEAAARAEAAGP